MQMPMPPRKIGFTALLAFSGPGSLWLTIALIVLSNFFYGSGENIVAAFCRNWRPVVR